MAIHREYVRETESEDASESGGQRAVDDQPATTETAAVDADLDDEARLENARNASNGEKFERLWSGNTGDYDSQSEAEMALCCLLAFWTGGDPAEMYCLFGQSGLHREKWGEVHSADGSTSGEKTIERATATTAEFYDRGTGERRSA